MLIMPADHVIADANAFVAAVRTGIPHAEEGAIVTFGAKPTEANTQFGYIEAERRPVLPTVRHRSRGSSKSPTPRPRQNMSKAAATSGTPASSF